MNAFVDVVKTHKPLDALREVSNMFGIRSVKQIRSDLAHVLGKTGSAFQLNLSSAGFFRPDLGVPTYLGKYPRNRLAPILHCFDRVGGGKHYSQRVTRDTATDFRGKHLSYDEHDGVDFTCPIGTRLVAAAPGHVVMIRDTWLRGGITIAVDHGHGVLTQYTHCWKSKVQLGQRVKRGETLALSGSAGLDMTLTFPWLPPHIHFMVWDHGKPIDPYLQEGEPDHTGTWLQRNAPSHVSADTTELPARYSEVNEMLVQQLAGECHDEKIADEIRQLNGNPHFLAAFLEDSFHHHAFAWPNEIRSLDLRPRQSGNIKLSLPLDQTHYDGAVFADAWITDVSFWQ